jgi:hypothetical protein
MKEDSRAPQKAEAAQLTCKLIVIERVIPAGPLTRGEKKPPVEAPIQITREDLKEIDKDLSQRKLAFFMDISLQWIILTVAIELHL